MPLPIRNRAAFTIAKLRISHSVWLLGIMLILSLTATTSLAAQSSQTVYAYTLTWSPDGSKIATSGDGFLTIWDATTEEQLLNLPIGDTFVINHDWSPDGTKLVSASDDQLIRIWNISDTEHPSGELLAAVGPITETGFLEYVDWKPDGQLITAAVIGEFSGGGGLWLLDANTYQITSTILLGSPIIISWNPDTATNQIAYAGQEEGPKIATLTDPPILSADPIGGRDIAARTFAWNSAGTQLAVAYEDGDTYVWDTITNTQITILSSDDHIVVRSLAWSPDNQSIVTASGDGTIRFWDSADGTLLQTSDPQTGIVVAFSSDGAHFAYAISSQAIEITSVPARS